MATSSTMDAVKAAMASSGAVSSSGSVPEVKVTQTEVLNSSSKSGC